jgi:hypothetical protein
MVPPPGCMTLQVTAVFVVPVTFRNAISGM